MIIKRIKNGEGIVSMMEMNGIYVFNVGNHYHFYTGAEEYIGTVVFPDKQISKLAERNALNLITAALSLRWKL